MSKVYSVFEAKTHLSELLRAVKAGSEITVTERGTPIAKVVPYQEDREMSVLERMDLFEKQGILRRARSKWVPFKGVRRPGALKRFLKDRE